ncbi:hypothetical protein DY000_02049116 [Brassica cretica]|uniref:PUB 62/63 C-terminal domain-containing protein n=1 Tax=Brassica cretica TaxID=69181 RepID=A0ABQ7EPP4_BRACR|nr:hypothetical protein DY000_02049116 [Brassica cretica]
MEQLVTGATPADELSVEEWCDVSGRRDTPSSSLSNSIESLRTILSDPITKLAALVGWEAVGTTQCLNGWYVLVKTLDNAESVKLRYRSLAKATEDPSAKATPSKMISSWL